MSYQINEIGSNQCIVLNGLVNIETIKEIDQFMRSRPDYANAKYHIWDFRKVEEINIPLNIESQLPDIESIRSHWNNNHKLAIIPDTNNSYEPYLIFADSIRVSTGWECKIFAEYDDALNWCNP